MRPPYWSAQMPRIRRISDTVRIGVPTSRPNCVSLRPRSFLICTPTMEKIVHTAKHTVKASVLIVSAVVRPRRAGSTESIAVAICPAPLSGGTIKLGVPASVDVNQARTGRLVAGSLLNVTQSRYSIALRSFAPDQHRAPPARPYSAIMAAVPRPRPYAGPALLAYGFRPFFLVGSVWAAIEVLAWMPMAQGTLAIPTAFSPRDWHVHELLFGYLPAVIAGFLLTAIPNWTGRLPLRGASLAVL